jgi:hypothetical protein
MHAVYSTRLILFGLKTKRIFLKSIYTKLLVTTLSLFSSYTVFSMSNFGANRTRPASITQITRIFKTQTKSNFKLCLSDRPSIV